jgi:hypothetical protein
MSRIDEMLALRYEGKSLQAIGDKYLLTRERIRQLLWKAGCTFVRPRRVNPLCCRYCGDHLALRRTKYHQKCLVEQMWLSFNCERCGAPFQQSRATVEFRRRSGSWYRENYQPRFCSMKCYKPKPPTTYKPCKFCGVAIELDEHQRWSLKVGRQTGVRCGGEGCKEKS